MSLSEFLKRTLPGQIVSLHNRESFLGRYPAKKLLELGIDGEVEAFNVDPKTGRRLYVLLAS